MSLEMLDITPDPNVLLALTHTPLKPLEALCELIDNGIDAFRAAEIAGTPVRHPLLEVTIPGQAQVSRGEGVVRVVDNGAGLDRPGLQNTLKAGFSGKNKYDTLGLFGMGFNIATGKMGRRTTVVTARKEDTFALRVVLDLPAVVSSRKFSVPVEEIAKPGGFDHGTIVEVADWWPSGEPNANFVAELAQIPKRQLRQQVGRRYATLLRRGEGVRARILINTETVDAFEHCAWSSSRFVERQGWGVISAMVDVNQVLQSSNRCVVDGAVIPAGSSSCLACGSEEFRTIEERIRGWLGVQRFDDNNKFGIDLIRNGRAIRVGEKETFFNYVNDLGESIKEYPTDQQTGRLIGEIHLDHVPVDFQKQDFQRTTEEWQRAVTFLRGGSLLPSNWNDGSRNQTPISKLFQGYRKVRNYGRPDMYMGRYDETSGKAVRIGREVERDLYERFLKHEVGYYDDTNWWEYVESATVPPIVSLEECSGCGFQNPPNAETCGDCGKILIPKVCDNCKIEIALSAATCPNCGASQIPDVKEPWKCFVCSGTNEIDDDKCVTCGSLRGAENPNSPEVLRRDSIAANDLSISSKAFRMADGRRTEPLEVLAYRSGMLRPVWNGEPVPAIALRSAGKLEVFLNDAHPLFTRLGVRLQEAVAVEAAQYLYSMRSDLVGRLGHSVQNISAVVLADTWGDGIATGPERTSDAIRELFVRITDRLTGNVDAADFYQDLDQFEQRELADRLISAGFLDELAELRQSGRYLAFVGPGVLAKFFTRAPDGWFGSVWTDRLPDAVAIGAAAAASAREELVGIFSRCLDDCAAYLRFSYTDSLIVARAQASSAFLEAHLL